MLRIRNRCSPDGVRGGGKSLGMGLSAFARMSMIERARKEGVEI